MANFVYANTNHADLFSLIHQSTDGAKPSVVELNGEKWIEIAKGTSADVSFPVCDEIYISFEVQFSRSDTYNYCYADLHYGEKADDGLWSLILDRQGVSSYGKEQNKLIAGAPMRLFYHQWSNNGKEYTTVYSSNGTIFESLGLEGANKKRYLRFAREASTERVQSAFYVRNIIVSQDPITYADTIHEVSVVSAKGDGWHTSGDHIFTQKKNASAVVQFDKDAIEEICAVETPKYFVYAGLADREGEDIQNMYVENSGEVKTMALETGHQLFGAAYAVNAETLPDTVTITSLGGVKK